MTNRGKARIVAETRKALADAEACQTEVILKADSVLAQKLHTEVEFEKVWADAFARRNILQSVFGAAKRLAYDRTIEPQTRP